MSVFISVFDQHCFSVIGSGLFIIKVVVTETQQDAGANNDVCVFHFNSILRINADLNLGHFSKDQLTSRIRVATTKISWISW